MEYNQTTSKTHLWHSIRVLILVLMEYNQTAGLKFGYQGAGLS